ncbi:MAG: phage integrase SAM-like domain-containing protein [Bacteroidetes bacterium]|nr:phage integrase SAM-like domain-containing protein [Bacteroidota bacterium]
MKANTQIGTASFLHLHNQRIGRVQKNLSIHDVTPSFLENFERHLIAKGNSVSTVGIYRSNFAPSLTRQLPPVK